jgi:tetratricopeptide (TPR) repeat protein
MFYEAESKKNSDIWNIVHAGTYWRRANFPQRVLKITEGITSNDIKGKAAMETNRGGAYRDLELLFEAGECAKKAILLNPTSYHAYNLLGAICFQSGDPEEGDKNFQKALQLGAPPKNLDETIRKSVTDADKDEQIKVAHYLLNKDPIKYKWAEFYLN